MVRRTVPKAVRRFTGGGLPRPPALVELREPGNRRGSLALPSRCTESEDRACNIAKSLPALNDLLYFVSYEVIEVAPGKVALRSLPKCAPNIYEDDKEYQRYAAVFIYYMLAQHRCVVNAQLLLSPRENRSFMLLVSNGLKSATSLTHLHLCSCELNAEATSNAFTAIHRLLMLQLEELSLDKVLFVLPSRLQLEVFTQGLMSTESLKILKIIQVNVVAKIYSAAHRVDFPAAVMRALTSNTSLLSLSVDASFPVHKSGTSFKRMLASPRAPAELTVMCLHPLYRRKSNLVFEALMRNKTVKVFSVEGFDLDRTDAKAFSKLFERNETIEDVSLVEIKWTIMRRRGEQVDDHRIGWHAEHLVRALAATKSLRRLAVKFAFSSREMQGLLLAAIACTSLNELIIQSLGIMQIAPLTLSLIEVGDLGKMTIGMLSLRTGVWSATMISFFGSALQVRPSFSINELYTPLGHPCRMSCTCAGDHLSSLKVAFFAEHVHPKIAQALRVYLPLTRSLRRLDLRFPTSLPLAHAIIQGISLNNSIEELSLKWFLVSEEDVDVLCDWLASSLHLHSLQVALAGEGDKLVLQKLATVLQSSYTLTSIDVHIWPDDEAGLNAINLVRRNYGIFQCAAAFVLGSSLKRAAMAFELVPQHPQLLAVVQRLGSLTEANAELKIQEGARRLQNEFWQLAGIVKRQLVCNYPQTGQEGSSGEAQLDKLNPYVMEHVRSFLKIGDVLDEEDGAQSSSSGATRGTGLARRRMRKVKR